MNQLVAWTTVTSLADQLIDQAIAVAGEKISSANQPLLQTAVRIQSLNNSLCMTAKRCFLLQFEVGSHAAQTVHLVAHLACRNLRRSPQTFVQRFQIAG